MFGRVAKMRMTVRCIVLAISLVLVVDATARSCYQRNQDPVCDPGTGGLPCQSVINGGEADSKCSETYSDYSDVWRYNSDYCKMKSWGSFYCPFYSTLGVRMTADCCTELCLLDSLKCNGTWYPEQCKCIGDMCREKREECESLGGRFVGYTDPLENSGQGCCKGTCDLCGTQATQMMLERLAKICCDAGLAPPPLDVACYGDHIAQGCGVSTSVVCKNTLQGNACNCLQPDSPRFLSQLAMCPGYSSSSEGTGSSSSGQGSSDSQSSGSGSSSSGGGSSGSGNGEDFEYDYNDSLHKIIVNTGETAEGIKDLIFCLQQGACKNDLSIIESGVHGIVHVDSLIYEMIKDKMDSTIKLDNKQLEALRAIAVNILNGNEEAIDHSDSLSQVMFELIRENMDTVSIVMTRLADSLSVSTDSILKHLDSIWQLIDPEIQDSIFKYQKYANDDFDSVLYGTGKGFSLIDSLIDTSVKYFKDFILAVDTLDVNVEFGDSLYDSLHGLIEGISWIPSGIGYEFGYGDTATSTLRQDLQWIRYGIDSNFASLQGVMYGIFDSLGNVIGAVDMMGNVIGDSIHNLRGDVDRVGHVLGDSLGVLNGTVGAVNDSLSKWYNGNGKTGLDTSGNGVGTDMNGVFDGSSVYADSGAAGGIYNAGRNDPDLHFGPGGIFDTSRTVSGDTIPDTAFVIPSVDSMVAGLRQSIQDDYDSAERTYKAYFDTLREEMQLINWDSVILAPLAQKVPNTNTCPEECFAMTSVGAPTRIGSIPFNMGSFNLNFGLCTAWPVLGGMNVMMFIRLLLRVVTAVTCVYIGAWFIAGRKS